MRTLVYCTAYAAAASVWATRYRMWLDAILGGGLDADQVLLVDDGSATLPGWPDLQLFSGDTIGEAFTVGPRGPALLFHFREHLGRADILNFPGWHRSYVFGALYAEAQGFERVVHIESDAFLLSQAARDFVTGCTDDWAAPWNELYGMPEMAISVAAGDGLRRLAAFARQPYAALIGQSHEKAMPYSRIDKALKGKRYEEISTPVPAEDDYAAQIPWRREHDYYWWLPGRQRPAAPAETLTLRFCEGGNGMQYLDGGWATPEPEYHWMVGAESLLRLPAMPGRGPGVLRLGVTPCVHPDHITSQQLIINVNGRRIGAWDITEEVEIGCDIPASVLRQQGHNLVRFIHPDAVALAALSPKLTETRRLAVSLEWLTFERW